MSNEDNGNIGFMKPTLSSTEDLSEYTDADESMSAPTELLAEFLSAVMMKEYENALKYCKLILHYEPNNATAKEFYPLILKKIKQQVDMEKSLESEEETEDSSSDSEENSSSSSSSESSSNGQEEDEDDDENVEVEEIEINSNVDNKKNSKGSSNGGDNTTGSYSSLEDDEDVIEQLAALSAKYKVDNEDFGNGNKINNYEKTGDLNSIKDFLTIENYESNIYSDSESPTEPVNVPVVAQETISKLRARVIPN